MAILYLRRSVSIPSDTARSVLRQTLESVLKVGQPDKVKDQAAEASRNKTEEKEVEVAESAPDEKTEKDEQKGTVGEKEKNDKVDENEQKVTENVVRQIELSPIPNKENEYEIGVDNVGMSPQPKRRHLGFDEEDESPTKVNIKTIRPGLAAALNRPITITETVAAMGIASGVSDGD